MKDIDLILEKQIDKYMVSVFKNMNIYFLHIKNSISKSRSRNYETTVFGSGVAFQCHRYFPDFMFMWAGNVYMAENGLKNGDTLLNKGQKHMQRKVLDHCVENGGVVGYFIHSIEDAKHMFRQIGIIN